MGNKAQHEWAPSDQAVAEWNERNGGYFQGRLNEARVAIDDARSLHLLDENRREIQESWIIIDEDGSIHVSDRWDVAKHCPNAVPLQKVLEALRKSHPDMVFISH